MMCSAQELLLDNYDCDGIIELQDCSDVGQALAPAIGMDDIIFDISVTPNRADCFCIRGIARDLAAAGLGELVSLPDLRLDNTGDSTISVTLTTDKCHYFSTTTLDGISGETPAHIARRLRAVGQRLIGLPVDVANYVCLDIGVPLHIFDMDKLPSRLTVRDSHTGERLRTLDGKETVLCNDVVVIASEPDGWPLSVAGIMGGEDSAYSATTTRILIEGAYFDRVAIAKAGQALRISSDARVRCERGVDPKAVDFAVRYATSIIAKVCNCKISVTKRYGALPTNKVTINLALEKFKALTNLGESDFVASVSILKALGITALSTSDSSISVETPSWRYDLEIEEDLIEEILRISGFENINEVEIANAEPIIRTYVIDKITDALVYNRYDEVKTFPFTNRETAALFVDDDKLLTIKDAVSEDGSVLSPSVIVSHLELIKNAQNKSQRNSRVFEIGRGFFRDGTEATESNVVVATISEKLTDRSWRGRQEYINVFDIKEILERLLNMTVSGCRLSGEAPKYYHPGRSGSYVFQKDMVVAHFGEIHPTILRKLDIAGPVACFEMFIDKLPEIVTHKVRQLPVLSQYQPVTRDLSFIVRKLVHAADVINTIRRLKINEITDIGIFDVYESDEIGSGKKAIALEITMQSSDGTLLADQITNMTGRIVDAVSRSCGGQLRDR
jgi:phenylalanyl-tRNA synthetase beta chain